MRAAAIDIGSNSVLLTIAEKTGLQLRPLCDEARVTGLSRKLSAQGEITPDAMLRTQQTLIEYRELIDQFQPERVIAVATEALRKACNRHDVQTVLEKTLGYPIEIISGEREASLSFWSVQNEWPETNKAKVVFDIGGASTELCLGDHNGIHNFVSLKFGSVYLTERFAMREGCKLIAPQAYIEQQLQNVDWKIRTSGFGVAGTMTSLISVHRGLKTFSRDEVHKQKITRADAFTLAEKVAALSTEERRKIPGMPENRADVSAAGFLVVVSLMTHFGWDEVICMDAGVRYGLLHERLSRN